MAEYLEPWVDDITQDYGVAGQVERLRALYDISSAQSFDRRLPYSDFLPAFTSEARNLDTNIFATCRWPRPDAPTLSSYDDALVRAESVCYELDDVAVELPHRSDVRDYLCQYPSMCEITLEAARASRTEFGDEVTLHLDVRVDPETSDRYLRLCIRAKEYDAEFVRRLRSLRDRCSVFDGSGGVLLVTSDFA